jgi:hypothetical protein
VSKAFHGKARTKVGPGDAQALQDKYVRRGKTIEPEPDSNGEGLMEDLGTSRVKASSLGRLLGVSAIIKTALIRIFIARRHLRPN